MKAAGHDYVEVAKMLLAASACVNLQDHKGQTALLWAAGHGRAEIVQVLFNAGADINLQANDGNTAFTWAAGHGRVATVKVLFNVGADVNLQANDGNTAFTWAAVNGYLETVKFLLDNNADVSLRDNRGHTAYDLASLNNKQLIMNLLKTYHTQLPTVNYSRLLPPPNFILSPFQPPSMHGQLSINSAVATQQPRMSQARVKNRARVSSFLPTSFSGYPPTVIQLPRTDNKEIFINMKTEPVETSGVGHSTIATQQPGNRQTAVTSVMDMKAKTHQIPFMEKTDKAKPKIDQEMEVIGKDILSSLGIN